MRTLLITRHAKSSWDDSHLDDFDRPLNARGLRDTPRMARHLVEQGLVPGMILSSGAQRARQTASILADRMGLSTSAIMFTDELYLADPDTILGCIARHNTDCKVLMLVAHNPGLTELVEQLTGEDIGNLPTCGVAVIQLEIPKWSEVLRDQSAELVALYRPKQLP